MRRLENQACGDCSSHTHSHSPAFTADQRCEEEIQSLIKSFRDDATSESKSDSSIVRVKTNETSSMVSNKQPNVSTHKGKATPRFAKAQKLILSRCLT